MGKRGPKPKDKVPDPPPGQAKPPDPERQKARDRVEALLGGGTPGPVPPPVQAPVKGKKGPSKGAQELARVITRDAIDTWKPWAEAFAFYCQQILEAVFPQDWAKWTPKEIERSVFAWTMFLATCPPENIRALAVANLGLVHVSLLGGRIVKWAVFRKQEKEKQDERSESKSGSEEGIRTGFRPAAGKTPEGGPGEPGKEPGEAPS